MFLLFYFSCIRFGLFFKRFSCVVFHYAISENKINSLEAQPMFSKRLIVVESSWVSIRVCKFFGEKKKL